MFIIIMPVYNAAASLAASVELLRRQTCGDFRCLLLDDCSTDESVRVARAAIGRDSRFEVVVQTTKHYALGNACVAMERAAPAPDDVVVLLDGDDALAGPGTLEHLETVYRQEDCWLTYGSYTTDGSMTSYSDCLPYPPTVVARNAFRRAPWRASHLKSFRADLWTWLDPAWFTVTGAEWRQFLEGIFWRGRFRTWAQLRSLSPADMLDPSGRWFRRCYDKAIMYPLLEMTGTHARFVPDVLYHYRANPHVRRSVGGGGRENPRLVTRGIRTILENRAPQNPRATRGVA